MKQLLRSSINNPIVQGTTILIVGGLLTNVCNFLFNLFMTRNLSVQDFGILASMISIITLCTIPAGSVTQTVVKFGAMYFAKDDKDKIRSLFKKITGICLAVGLGIFVIFLAFNAQIQEFFHMPYSWVIIMAGVIIIFGYINVVTSSLLQAMLAFKFITGMNFVSTFIKLLVGVGLVLLGYSVTGAIWAVVLSFCLPYFFSFYKLRFLFHKSEKKVGISLKEIIGYGIPATLTVFGLMAFITMDIILVKHFYSPHDAGLYAGLSLISRVIFFLTAPISTVMFPLISQKHATGENSKNTFLLCLLFVFIPSICLSVLYFIFPEFAITFFTKKDYLAEKGLLGYFGLFITMYSLLTIIINYFLSINYTKIVIPVFFGFLLQFILIFLFHSSFFQIVMISLGIVSSLVIVLLGLFFKDYGEK